MTLAIAYYFKTAILENRLIYFSAALHGNLEFYLRISIYLRSLEVGASRGAFLFALH